MKKLIELLTVLFVLISSNTFAQSLFNWEHYYQAPSYFLDCGNYFISRGPEEIIKLDKSTLNYTKIPFPSDFRELNLHNNQYYDSSMQGYSSCQIAIKQGPDNKYILYNTSFNNQPGCLNIKYLFDGISFVSAPTTYQGFSMDSINFLEYRGGANYFYSKINGHLKLNKYDGVNLTYFDSLNSPINSDFFVNTYCLTTPNDNIFLKGNYSISVYHNNTWTTYDTTFFGCSYIYSYSMDAAQNDNFVIYNSIVNKLCIYNDNTGAWQQISFPTTMNHNTASPGNIYINATKYDNNGNLWIAGAEIFCKFDGTQFTDYYTTAQTGLPNTQNIFITNNLNNNSFIVDCIYNSANHKYIFNFNTLQFSTMPLDDKAVLPGNMLLPSLKDDVGNIFFGFSEWAMQDGLIKYDLNGNWSQFHNNNFNIDGAVYSLIKDTGNSIVVGYGNLGSSGPIKIHDTTFTILNDAANSYYHEVQDVAIDLNHHYWFGGGGAGVPQGLTEFNNGIITFHNNPNASANEKVYAVSIDANNDKWVSYSSFDGVYKLTGNSWTFYNSTNSPMPNDTVVKIVKDPNSNAMWFCTDGGFAKYDNGVWSVLNSSNSMLPCNDAENIYFADDSSIWYATKCGFSRVKNNNWETYTVNNSPLHNSDIESIVVGNDCRVWIATEFGLTSAMQECGAPQGKIIKGTVFQSNNLPAENTLVYIYKLNQSATDIFQVSNTYTDNNGNFDYFSKDSGQYYFQAVVNPFQYPTQITAYNDSGKIVQLATPVQLSSDGNYFLNIHLCEKLQLGGNCTYKGQLVSYNNSQRIGSVRVLLMQNNQAVESVLSNVDGSFEFTNLINGIYTLWVDKFGFSNANAPIINFDCADLNTHVFEILDTSLNSIPLGLNQQDENNQLLVFPNPTNDKITIIIPYANTDKTKVELFDIAGNKILSTIVNTNTKTQIDVSSIQKGVYILKVGGETKKIIKN